MLTKLKLTNDAFLIEKPHVEQKYDRDMIAFDLTSLAVHTKSPTHRGTLGFWYVVEYFFLLAEGKPETCGVHRGTCVGVVAK